MAERRGRIVAGEAAAAMGRLRRLPLEDAGAGSDVAVLALAMAYGLTAYDAAYLALAKERGLTESLDIACKVGSPKAARAVGRIKRAVQTGAEIPFETALALERELQQQLFQSEDAKEGLDAYVNKRKAVFEGK